MALSWKTETAGGRNPLIKHPSAHWWYTLEDEKPEPVQTELLALDLEDLAGESGAACASVIAAETSRELRQGRADTGIDRVLRRILDRVADGHDDHSLFAPVLPEGARCSGGADPQAVPFEVPDVPIDSTVVGVIDDGIAFAHPVFQLPDRSGSRFASIWQQDAAGLRGASADVPFGHVYSRAEIESRLQTADGCEETFYAALPRANRQQRVPFGRRRLHGTHVLDLAAGNGRGDAIDQAPEKFPIVAVNLPTALVSDTGGTFMASAMILGVRDIMRRTEAMMAKAGGKFPLVINLSFGLGGVGKNGGHLIAAALERAMDYWHRRHKVPMRVVLPAGNSFQSQMVARARVTASEPHDAVVHVAPHNTGSTYVEIALARAVARQSTARLSVSVALPKGEGRSAPQPPKGPARMHSVQHLVDTAGADGNERELVQCGVYYGYQRDFAPEMLDPCCPGTEVVTVALPPNMAVDGHRPLPVCGDWRLTVALADGEVEPQDIEIRVLRNDIPNRLQLVEQRSWLKDPLYRSYDSQGFVDETLVIEGCSITRRGTLNALSGGAGIVTVAASYAHKERMAEYSAAGPGGSLAEGATVSIHAPAEDSASLAGRRAAGHRAGSTVRIGGTSIAAPLVARRLLQELALWHRSPSRDPRSYAPISGLVVRGPTGPADRVGLGGLLSANER